MNPLLWHHHKHTHTWICDTTSLSPHFNTQRVSVLSNIGGLMGLCLGMSMISVIELLQLLLALLWKAVGKLFVQDTAVVSSEKGRMETVVWIRQSPSINFDR